MPILNPAATTALDIQRLPQHHERYYELKDPSVVQLGAHSFMLFASIGNSIEQHWRVGRFVASDPFGTWQELEPVEFSNIAGPQLCAPAVEYTEVDGQPLWTMYIQTACFEENGVIAVATSHDGWHFTGQEKILACREHIQEPPKPVVGVYDIGTSSISYQGTEYHCALYSGYRRIGCGDLYLSVRKQNECDWTKGVCILSQEEVPFHNHPDYEFYEWGLEGAKLIQLQENVFALIGVCFMPKPHEFSGTRQRVFFAVSKTPFGPFTPVGMPIEPQKNDWNTGENGHPDTLLQSDQLVVLYQERAGTAYPWHIRIAAYDVRQFTDWMVTTAVWDRSRASSSTSSADQQQVALI